MPSDSNIHMPPTVEEFLRSYANTTVSGCARLCAERLLVAPCSKWAFSAISRRLRENTCRYDVAQQLRFIADIVMIAGTVDFRGMRDGEIALRSELKAAAQAARALSYAIDLIQTYGAWSGLSGETLSTLFDTEWFPHGLDDFAARAEAASEEALCPPYREFSRAMETRQFNELASYVITVDARLAEFVSIGYLPAGFRLSNAEMAGLAWAVLGRENASIFSQRGEDKDTRAEAVRKTRQEGEEN